MVISQGFARLRADLGHGSRSWRRSSRGRTTAPIFGTLTVALIGGGAAGPWITGVIHDATGSYQLAFLLTIACCVVSAAAIWIAAPRKVRLVPGRASRVHRAA